MIIEFKELVKKLEDDGVVVLGYDGGDSFYFYGANLKIFVSLQGESVIVKCDTCQSVSTQPPSFSGEEGFVSMDEFYQWVTNLFSNPIYAPYYAGILQEQDLALTGQEDTESREKVWRASQQTAHYGLSGQEDSTTDMANARVKFGLQAQGHIETIFRMLEEFGNNALGWSRIGAAIHWEPATAARHFISYLLRKEVEFISVEKEMPRTPCQRCYVIVENDNGTRYQTMAEYVPDRTVLFDAYMSDDAEPDDNDYDETTDQYYASEGWYEWQAEADIKWLITGKVIAWKPLFDIENLTIK